MKKQIIAADIFSACLLLLFLYTAISKLAERYTFELALSMSPLINPYASLISWSLPAAELITCMLLFFPATRLKGLYASLMLITAFTLYLGYMLWFTAARPCSCGGIISQLSWGQHLVFNLFVILFCLSGILIIKKQQYETSST